MTVSFLPGSKKRTRMSAFTILFSIELTLLARVMREEKEKSSHWKEVRKLYLQMT
jgi:hypothetical protein